MVFSSMIFLWVFFPVTLISYYLLLATRKQEIVNLLLLFMSLLFYTFGEPKYILLLFITVAVNYFGGLLIEKAGESNWKKAALTATVVLDLGILGYFKYYTKRNPVSFYPFSGDSCVFLYLF